MKKVLLISFSFFYVFVLWGQEPNYDESKVPSYVLPDPLTMENGEKIATENDWIEKRRPEIL